MSQMPIALRLLFPSRFKTLWWICVSTCVRYGESWMVQILGHTLKNWLLQVIMHGWPCLSNQAMYGALPICCLGTWSWNSVGMCFGTVPFDIARFCLRAHTLRVETGCWQIHNRLCDKCDLHDVQDEKHVLFSCPRLEMCYLRRRFKEQFADFAGRTYIGDTGAFCFNNIGAEDVKLLLLKQTYKSFLFLSETMDIFCRTGSVQQAQQSTHLAEGLNPL